MSLGTARRALLPAGARWRIPTEFRGQLPVWGRVLGGASAIGAVAGAGQLGVAYGLGLVRFGREFPTDGLWSTQLTWIAWFAILAGLAGAVAGHTLARRYEQPLELSGRVAVAVAGGLGASIVVPLAGLPARAAELASRDAASPVLEASLTAGLGVVAGILTAVAVLSVRLVAVSITLLIGLVWLLALGSVAPSLPAGAELPQVRLAVLDLPALAGAQPALAVLTAPLMALLVCGAIAAAARARGLPPLQTAVATAAAPGLLALTYLIGSPGTGGSDLQTTPYAGALVGVAAGLLVSLVVGVVRMPTRAVGDEPATPVAAGGPGPDQTDLGPEFARPLSLDDEGGLSSPDRLAGLDPVTGSLDTPDAPGSPALDSPDSPGSPAPGSPAPGSPAPGSPAPVGSWPPPASEFGRRAPAVEPPSWAVDQSPPTSPAEPFPPEPFPAGLSPPEPGPFEVTSPADADDRTVAEADSDPPLSPKRKRRWLGRKRPDQPEPPVPTTAPAGPPVPPAAPAEPPVPTAAPVPRPRQPEPAADQSTDPAAAGPSEPPRPRRLDLDSPILPLPDIEPPRPRLRDPDPAPPAPVSRLDLSSLPIPAAAAPDPAPDPSPVEAAEPEPAEAVETTPETESAAVPKPRRQQRDEEHIDWISSLAGKDEEPEPPSVRRRLRPDREP